MCYDFCLQWTCDLKRICLFSVIFVRWEQQSVFNLSVNYFVLMIMLNRVVMNSESCSLKVWLSYIYIVGTYVYIYLCRYLPICPSVLPKLALIGLFYVWKLRNITRDLKPKNISHFLLASTFSWNEKSYKYELNCIPPEHLQCTNYKYLRI